ncbi:hypothetical protein J7J00_20540 [Bacillus sp. ISL-4]|nr:hypothetical protein [Bacillus sp. ISL-4]MBT2667837.1 hypothetical protein [Bacillus sp. ISL-4]
MNIQVYQVLTRWTSDLIITNQFLIYLDLISESSSEVYPQNVVLEKKTDK